MADQKVLSQVLGRFAVSMTTRYDVPDVLHDLCDGVVEVLDSTGAGVALLDDGALRFVTASGDAAVAAEEAQERTQSGPCRSSIEAGHPIAVADVRDHADRWPDFVASLDVHGQHAVLAVPLILDQVRVGSLDVYQRGPREWSDDDVAAATSLAAVAAAYLFNARELADSRRLADQLQHALESRVVIEQAKGIVAGGRGITPDEAFERIRSYARANHRVLVDLAKEIVDAGADVLDRT